MMNYKPHILLLSFVAISIHIATAQMNPRGIAPGLVYPVEKQVSVNEYSLEKSLDKLMDEDIRGIETGVAYRIGYAIPIYRDLFETGKWIELGDGRRFFRAVLKVPGALAVNVAFEDFYLPEHSTLFFYSADKSQVFGGYNEADNHKSRMFPGPLIQGETIVIEYFEPQPELVVEKPSLLVKDIMHYYRSVNEVYSDNTIGASGDCNVNINCPEGTQWQDQKRGIVRILLRAGSSAGWCTGSLVNNTAQDGKPYLLSAEHCGSAASASDHNLWQFRFNFEWNTCAGEGFPGNQTITGSTRLALSAIAGGSDFRLLLLHHTPPASYRPYYNGWDRTPRAPRSGVGIHHPAGDVKKVSTYERAAVNVTTAIVSGSTMATNSTWNVTYTATATNHGVTEPGSSGSPIFNEDNLIVGTLTGGSSSCSSPNGSNIYGKFNYHWESNGTAPSRQLKHWLDPLDLGLMSLNGLDPYPVPVVTDLSASVANKPEVSVALSWTQPEYPLEDNWFSHAGLGRSVIQSNPERASLFNYKEILGVDTFYLKGLSHYFGQEQDVPWGINNRFRFRVYDQDGATLIFESAELTATNYLTNYRTVSLFPDNEIMITRPFYVSIVPMATGQPTSLAIESGSSTKSVFGSAGSWSPLVVNETRYELLTHVFGSSTPGLPVKSQSANSNEYDAGESVILGPSPGRIVDAFSLPGDTPLKNNKVFSNLAFFRIYRNGASIGATNGNETTFIDTEGLSEGQTYTYTVTSVLELKPDEPGAQQIESGPSNVLTVPIAITSAQGTSENKLLVYPNPGNGLINIVLPAESYSDLTILVFDVSGRVLRSHYHSGAENMVTLDLQDVAPGVYFLRIDVADKVWMQRISVNR